MPPTIASATLGRNLRYAHPRFWPTWLKLGCLRLLAPLPPAAGWRVGAWLGKRAWQLLPARRRVTRVNLALCFPGLNDVEREQLARASFAAVGIGLVETAWSWWGNIDRLPLRVLGAEHLRAALALNRGVLVLGAHYSPLELGARHFAQALGAVDTLYRPHDNPLLDAVITRQRSRHTQPIPRHDLRAVRRRLLANNVVWMAPDQDLGRRNAEFTPFFGHLAATVTTTSRFARLNDSPVLFLRHQREGTGYVLELVPMPDFPGTDATADAANFNRVLEHAIRRHPEQYLWMHKRFKTQPDGNQLLYRAAGC